MGGDQDTGSAIGGSNGIVLVLSGPSGVGKTTVYRQLMAQCPEIRFSVSCTTRAPRAGEVDGQDYHFLGRDDFLRRAERAEFLEHAEVHGNLYGTLRAEVEDEVKAGRDVLLDIDIQGARLVRKSAAGTPVADALVFVFVGPPSLPVIEQRLRGRGSDAEEVIQRRLDNAKSELGAWCEYDYLVVNDRLEDAVAELAAVRTAARCSTSRRGAPWTRD